MDNSLWYAIAIVATTASLLCIYLLKKLLRCIHVFVIYYFLKYLYYNYIHKHVRGSTWFHGILIILFMAGNATYLILKHNDFLKQTGIISTINLIPLALRGHMNLLASLLGLDSEDYN